VNFKIILLSIVIEALPFVLFSVLISAILHNFVTEDMIGRIIPKNTLLSIIPAAFLGIFFPICDCGMVPVVRRLINKGVPLHTAVTFMLAAPIVNPVVTAATVFAFRTSGNMVLFRLGAALGVACVAGWLTSLVFKGNELTPDWVASQDGCSCCSLAKEDGQVSFLDKVFQTIYDAGDEFFEMGKYLLLGAMLGSVAQIMLPRVLLYTVGQSQFLSIGVMMFFAFSISVCSSADAFIASSFLTTFSTGSLVAFMVFGPMVDLKNVLMLLHAFRWRFVVWLAVIVAALCFLAACLINLS
jgi:hypothetical protein